MLSIDVNRIESNDSNQIDYNNFCPPPENNEK